MKWFLKKWEGVIPHYDFRRWKIELWKSPKWLGYEKDIFNYFNYIDLKWIDDLENSLWKTEDKLTDEIRKIWNNIETQLKNKEKEKIYNISLSESIKKTIIDLIIFMDYKLLFYHIHKYFTNRKNTKKIDQTLQDKINKIAKVCWIEGSLNQLNKTLYDLTKQPRHRMFLYSDEDIFYFWDQPFHFRPNINNWTKDGNNFQTFFSRKWSRLYFPINKNIALIIENPCELQEKILLESW